MRQHIKPITPWACILPIALAIGLTACGGGGGGGSSSSGSNDVSKGYTLPSEISAVPTDSSSGSNSAGLNKSFSDALHRLAKAQTAAGLPATSDYAKAKSRTFVEEPALEQFDVIETVLSALGQTNYADEVANGAYQAVISWEEERDGVDVKQLQTWTVESTMIDGNHPTTNAAQKVNRVKAWIPERDERSGDETTIKAQFDIYTSAEIAEDGSFINYGEWDLNVYFDADPTAVDSGAPQGFFAASSRLDTNGITTLQVVDRGMRNEFELAEEMVGVLVRSQDAGYGIVQYPDWDACYGPASQDCSLLSEFPSKSAKYAYTETHLAVQEADDPAIYKDRNLTGAIRMVHRYGLFYADAGTVGNKTVAEGENVSKKLAFGFPVRFTMTALEDSTKTFENWGYYGAWQGRHELWGPSEGMVVDTGNPSQDPAATVFTRADLPPNQTAPTYTLAEFGGTFTKRNLVSAVLEDIIGVPVQTWVNNSSELFYINGAWRSCQDGWVDWMASPQECKDHDGSSKTTNTADNGFTAYTDWANLVRGPNDRRWINIGGHDSNADMHKEFMYLATDPGNGFNFTGAGLYEAMFDQQNGGMAPKSPAAPINTTDVSQLWVNISGSLHIQYTGDFSNSGTGWVKRDVESEDERTGQVKFSSTSSAFSPKQGEEYYINAAGNNYIVKRKGAADEAASYDVKRELQTAANPVNTDSSNSATILPTGTSYLATAWDKDVKYTLVEDPSDASYLLVEVLSDTSNNKTPGEVSDSQWGLQAFSDNGTANDTSDDKPLAIVDGSTVVVTVDDYGWPVDGQPRPVEFNWEKPDTNNGQSWGKQRFLKDSNGDYVILSNPVSLNDVAVKDSAGNAKGTLNLQFDGWMHGMPDIYRELEQNDWEITSDIAGKVVHIPAGTEATGDDGTRYFVKPLDTSLFLGVVSEQSITDQSLAAPDITQADAIDQTNLPEYTAHNMGAVPSGTDIKYTEGKTVE